MGTLISGILLLLTVITPALAAAPCPSDDYPPFYSDPKPFERAFASASSYEPANEKLTGITVPHHLTADRLVALGFKAASAFRYKRLIILHPDHFFQASRPFATTTRGFRTVLGPVHTDTAAAKTLLSSGDFVEESCLFGRDHGIRALLPFAHHYFPGAAVLPVAISIKAGRADWDRMVTALAPLVDDDTLIVQSTDFSHYLPQAQARAFDQQTLNVIASGSLDAIAALRQPQHADSVGALYIQTRLQQLKFGARPLALANENMQQYFAPPLSETTSYIVLAFGRFDKGFNNPATGKEHIYYFAGDTFFGRAMTRLLLQEDTAERITNEILSLTHGRPMVVNLEGVLLPDVPAALEHMTLGMPAELATDWLKRLNVAAVGLANNHALDLGQAGYEETRRALREAGIAHFGQGETVELPGLDVVGLTDIEKNGPRQDDPIGPELLDRLLRPDASRPVVAFVHWGKEYVPTPGPREQELADAMRLRSVSAIVGAHPHVASGSLVPLAGGDTLEVYSLGNFLFDQEASRSSGSLLELRVFEQGTVFARLIPLPNFFDMGKR